MDLISFFLFSTPILLVSILASVSVLTVDNVRHNRRVEQVFAEKLRKTRERQLI